VVVPVETASEKEQYSAATLRPRINRHLHRFLKPIDELDLERESSASEKLAPELPGTVETGGKTWEITRFDRVGLESPERLMEVLSGLDGSVRPVDWIRGGTGEAEKRLESFIRDRLDDYPEARNDPSLEGQSNLSPYLHFGQISPVRIALAVQEAGGEGVGAYLEELIVRRELSMNFCRYNDNYDSYDALPEWARKSLSEHLSDRRAVVYDLETLEAGRTDDPYWNASQLEMVQSGKMHGYMRMYWGKKILEWSESPRDAFANALYLNNKYELDGRDPNGFTGVAWCFGKHDRGWPERQVFGKVRYMNANGLRRKFKGIDAYVEKWSS
ncbi:MAG: deoxyribodipyrimidine photolyase, partial [Alkalispirochaetaceae bacterium]